MPVVRTEAVIPAPPEAVWAVLADFDRYDEWNPLNIRARGRAELGAKVAMTFLNLARPGTTMDQTVTVTTCEPGKALAWSGWVPLLFKGRHHFTLEKDRRRRPPAARRGLRRPSDPGLHPRADRAGLHARLRSAELGAGRARGRASG